MTGKLQVRCPISSATALPISIEHYIYVSHIFCTWLIKSDRLSVKMLFPHIKWQCQVWCYVLNSLIQENIVMNVVDATTIDVAAHGTAVHDGNAIAVHMLQVVVKLLTMAMLLQSVCCRSWYSHSWWQCDCLCCCTWAVYHYSVSYAVLNSLSCTCWWICNKSVCLSRSHGMLQCLVLL